MTEAISDTFGQYSLRLFVGHRCVLSLTDARKHTAEKREAEGSPSYWGGSHSASLLEIS
ncbi:hypothetical protein HMPREF1555_01218 [Porphyromonas gingivalis F0570]|uniref:Uncharacterized protein n=1 Tax=Porphyromonas gingivalis F0570 TaxID=1227271 RepID=A0A0E2LQ69_PORGN|nr:hypothetical protein HMPREF1555_01218 [Porphyromonas gingivalis F0570]